QSARALRHQGQGARWRQADAAQASRRPDLYGDVRSLLYRARRGIRRDKVKAYPPGCVVILPGDTPHFHWAKSGEYVTQVTAIGPLGLEYMSSKDDPRKQSLVD